MHSIIAIKTQGVAVPEVTLNGKPLEHDKLDIQDSLGAPFARLYNNGVRQFDCEVWVDETLRFLIPRDSPWARAAHQQMEAPSPTVPAGAPPAAIDHSLRPHLDPVLAEMKQHAGSEIIRSWQALHAMWAVYELNAADVLALIHSIADDPMLAMEMVQNVRPPLVREQLTAQIDQKLHNYIASSASLIDQTRRLTDRFVTARVRDAYDRRRNALAADGGNAFLRDLRNYALHYSIPFTAHTVSFNAGEPELSYKVELSTSMLQEWDGWKAPAKKFLAEVGAAVELRQVIAQHFHAYSDLWTWLFDQEAALTRLAVVAHDELAKEHDWILTGGAAGSPRRAWAIAPASEMRFPKRG